MAIPLDRISKVVIDGEWYSVEMGSFEVVDMAFSLSGSDEDVAHSPIGAMGYHFFSQNRDEYYGPLSSIDLFKLLDR